MKVIDAYHDPYQEYQQATVKRKEFISLKKKEVFRSWRNRQYRIQDGKCAWCLIELDRRGIVTHIDHVTPLRFEGKNEFKNFVLSCKRCNVRKYVRNDLVYPGWIKTNDELEKNKQRSKRLYREQIAQAKELLVDTEADQIRWILQEEH